MLGLANSRMKDFFDIWILARECEFDGLILGEAIRATFDRRSTKLNAEIPQSLTETFSADPVKSRQWYAFTSKNLRKREDKGLSEIVGFLKGFLEAPLMAAGKGEKFNFIWPAAGPWREKRGKPK